MRTLLCVCAFIPIAALRCEPPLSKPTPDSLDLALVAVDVQLDISVEVTDADTGAPIRGATVELVRSGIGKELAVRSSKHFPNRND